MKKMMLSILMAVVLAACNSFNPAPIKPNYTGRNFTKANPNEGFPTVVCDQCGEGGEASGGPGL